MNTAKSRARAVEQMNANQAIEGFYPYDKDLLLQRVYVAGTASIDDLLNHASDFAARCQA
jgi:hypothetical protein